MALDELRAAEAEAQVGSDYNLAAECCWQKRSPAGTQLAGRIEQVDESLAEKSRTGVTQRQRQRQRQQQ